MGMGSWNSPARVITPTLPRRCGSTMPQRGSTARRGTFEVPHLSGSTAMKRGTTALTRKTGPWPQSGTTAGVRAVLPLGAVLPPLLPLLVPQNPTRKTTVSNRGGSSSEPLRYYGRRPQAVLPLWERYYRLSALVVLPLWTAVLPLAPALSHYRENKEYSKENQNCHNFFI